MAVSVEACCSQSRHTLFYVTAILGTSEVELDLTHSLTNVQLNAQPLYTQIHTVKPESQGKM